MEKVLIELYIPALNQSYDVYIPTTSKIIEVEEMLIKAVTELTKQKFGIGASISLCDYESGKILDSNLYVQECNIDNGKKIMLI